jgi:hypothetical protein
MNIINSILKIVKKKSTIELTSGSVPISMFQDMRTRYQQYVKSHNGELPTRIYTKDGGSDYVLISEGIKQ